MHTLYYKTIEEKKVQFQLVPAQQSWPRQGKIKLPEEERDPLTQQLVSVFHSRISALEMI